MAVEEHAAVAGCPSADEIAGSAGGNRATLGAAAERGLRQKGQRQWQKRQRQAVTEALSAA